MSIQSQSVRDRFREYLRGRGLSFTPQRQLILEHLSSDCSHFNAEDLISVFSQKGLPVSRATVYRTLAHLQDAGFIREVALQSPHAHYEFVVNTKHHEHVVCERCGSIVEFTDPALESRIEKVASSHEFVITRHTVQIFGICRRCRERSEA